MARYGKAADQVHRIPDGTATTRGLTRNGFAAILLLGVAVIVVAAAQAPMAPTSPAGPLAPQAPAAPTHGNTRVTRYLIVSGDDMSGSWDSRDEPRFQEWRSKYGSHYAWFRQDGRDYILTDARILAQFEDAMAPQREVNSRQAEVNRHQADVNRAQAEVNRQQNLVNQGGEEQSRVNQLQSEVNGKQHVVNAEQDKVNQRQAVVNKEQGEVNQMQTRASAEIDKALQAVFDSARRQGLAHEAH
jgi:hypothetical protein